MSYLSVQITRLVSDDFPGFVEAQFTDANGKTHIIHEKLPVICDREDVNLYGPYPRPSSIACIIIQDTQESDIVTIDTDKPWGIETIDGQTQFVVNKHQVEKVRA